MTPHVSTTLLRTQTDARLVELIAAGHDRAFDAIVDRYRRPLLRYARRFLHEDARAEDVVQSAFVSAWTALSDGVTVRDLRPWLYRIVHNGALNVMKKPGRDDAVLIEASDLRPGPAAEVEQRENVRQALDTIARLPERQRTALLAVAFDGRSHADVGTELGLKEPAVRQLVSRARTTLRVAATAVTPWPVAAWLAGIGGAQAGDTAARVGEVVGGVGAGTVFGGGALKAGALVAAAGAVAVSAPKMAEVAQHHHAHRPAVTASAQAAETSARATARAAATAETAPANAPANRPGVVRARAVTGAAGGLTAGVRAHRRSGGGASGGWTRSTRTTSAPTTWTPGGSTSPGGTRNQAAAPTAPAPAPTVSTDTRHSGRHGGSDDRSAQDGAPAVTRQRRGHRQGTAGDRRWSRNRHSGETTSGDAQRRGGDGTATFNSGTRRADGGEDTPTTSGPGSGSTSGSETQSGDTRTGSHDTPDSGDSSGWGSGTTQPADPAPTP